MSHNFSHRSLFRIVIRKIKHIPNKSSQLFVKYIDSINNLKLLLARYRFHYEVKIKRHVPLDFTIVSSNCLGSRIYQELTLPYNTPFVGLFLYTPCYIKLLQNLKDYLQRPITFIEISKYDEANKLRMSLENNYPIGLCWMILKFIFFIIELKRNVCESGQDVLSG